MSRRRPTKKPQPKPAPNDGSPLGHLSEADLIRELARRRAVRGTADLNAIESFAEDAQRALGEETLAAAIEALPPEDTTPKPCPKCGKLVPVKLLFQQTKRYESGPRVQWTRRRVRVLVGADARGAEVVECCSARHRSYSRLVRAGGGGGCAQSIRAQPVAGAEVATGGPVAAWGC